MKFVLLVVLLAIFIAFVVMVVKAAKEWRWYHITSAVFTMLFAIILMFPTAGVLRSRQAWHQVKEKLEKQLEDVKRTNQEIRYGDPSNPNVPVGLSTVSLELSKIGTEAGRHWWNMRPPQGANPTGQITLQAPPPETVPGEAAPAAPTEPLVPAGLIVYVFAEGGFSGLEDPVPMIYLGEFRVVSSTPTTVTIAATFPLEQRQADAITGGRSNSWSLYEMLPLDGHEPFIAEGSKPDDDNVLGRVDDKLINTLLSFNNPNPNQETLNSYLNDGNRGAPEDPAARWVKIKFEKKHTIDVDSPDQRGALEGGFFDNSGRAVDSRLQRPGADEGKVTFNIGDTLVVKEEAAKRLIDQDQVASLVDTYYLRPLNDYRYVLRKTRLQIRALEDQIAQMNYEEKVLQAAIASTVAMLEKRQNEKLNLEQDLAQHQIENAALNKYFNEIREELRQMKEASSTLYRSNFSLLRQIEQLSMTPSLSDT